MRILIAIPHYAGEGPAGSPNESTKPRARQARLNALAMVLTGLHQNFGADAYGLDHGNRGVVRVSNSAVATIDVVVCTTGSSHLLHEIPGLAPLYRHRPSDVDPLLLGFECHKILAEARGRYDYFGYLEDDVYLADPAFFRKRRVFDRQLGPAALLQPNRFEASIAGPVRKLYVDYRVKPKLTEPYQDIADVPSVAMPYLDETIRFERTPYPSAGCFFLSAEQLAHWADGPNFLDGDHSYLSPLDSAATLSVMKSFRIYKPVLEQAWFLEVGHLSPRWVVGVNQRLRQTNDDQQRRTA